MHASRLVAFIDFPEEKALVVREPNVQDRRIYSLRLTDAGEERLRAIGEVARARNEAICFGLDPPEPTLLDCCGELQPATHSPGVSLRATRIWRSPEVNCINL